MGFLKLLGGASKLYFADWKRGLWHAPSLRFCLGTFLGVPYSFRSPGHGLGFRALSFPVARVRQVVAASA